MKENPKIHRAIFFPLADLSNKENYKRVVRVMPDGTGIERVFLSVPDMRHRENLICLHYLRHITRHFLKDFIGVNILSRDDPWDFKIGLSNGLTFNIEIVSIADHDLHFKQNKREERYVKCLNKENIKLHELKKLVTMFPDKETENLINSYINQGQRSVDLVPNPYFSSSIPIFLSATYETGEKLEVLLKEAIQKKANKKHEGKNNTVLIIDNRTGAYDSPDYFGALKVISPFANAQLFPEVWFYTGYYSDEEGNDAEFSFAPIKVTSEQDKILKEMMQNGNMDENGTYVWPESKS